MLSFLRKHWFDLGGALTVPLLALVLINRKHLSAYSLLMWIHLISLLLHQVEEYRFPGTFPGMINRTLFHSLRPERYPLNAQTALIINAGEGWLLYLMAALAGQHAVWLGLTAILVSAGNFIAHTFLFNIKGKTWYNAGMLSSWLLLAPCVCVFFEIVLRRHLATTTDYLIGTLLGILVNVAGIFKMIGWLADTDSPYTFTQRQLRITDRQKPEQRGN